MIQVNRVQIEERRKVGGSTGSLWTFEEARIHLRLSASTLYRLCEQRRIPYLKVGGLLRFERRALNAWLQDQSREPLKSWQSQNNGLKMRATRPTAGGLS